MIPCQVFSHIVFVKKLCIVILHLLGHNGSITFLWTPFLYLLKPFTPLLGDTEGVNSANLYLGMWKVTSLLCVDKRSHKHAGNTQLCVIKVLLGEGSRWIFHVMLGSGTNLRPNVQTFLPEKCTHFTKMYRKFRPKTHPSLWNVQKIWPKIVPICMPYAGQIFSKIYLFS